MIIFGADIYLAGLALRSGGGGAERFQVVLHVHADAASELDSGIRVSAETSRRLSCDATRVVMMEDARGEVLDVGRRTRTVPPPMRRALDRRDSGCRFPGCGLRHCDAHHVKHWADGGATSLANLVLLCRFHHRLLHEEGYTLELGDVGVFRSGHRMARRSSTCRRCRPWSRTPSGGCGGSMNEPASTSARRRRRCGAATDSTSISRCRRCDVSPAR